MKLNYKYYFFYWRNAEEYDILFTGNNGSNMTEYHEMYGTLFITDHFSYETFDLGPILAKGNTLEEIMPIVLKTMGENLQHFVLKFKGENYENI